MIRAVLDTNVLIASARSSNPAGPNREILERLRRGEFVLLYSLDVLHEYAAKLVQHGVPGELVVEFIRHVRLIGEEVPIRFFHLLVYPGDRDDIAFVLCAANGSATHLVTYDRGYDPLRNTVDFVICPPLTFLAALRE